MKSPLIMCFGLFYWMLFIASVSGHGRLMDPPSRSSMWRFGFDTPVNYDDNELFCGGLSTQWNGNSGKCGVCGDPYNVPQPRPNEAGGKYGRGIIAKNYRKGQVIKIRVEITANHLGYFEFRICPNNNPKKIVSQECLDKNLLTLEDGVSTRFYIQEQYLGDIYISLKLPKNLTCTQCVLQWQYRGENNWGRCADGGQGLGCGPQETFRACADVSISDDSTPPSTKPVTSPNTSTTKTSMRSTRKVTPSKLTVLTKHLTSATTPSIPTTSKDPHKDTKLCRAIPGMIKQVPGLDYWCKANCAMGHCPTNLCHC